jgi:hypothetical protein
MNFEFSYDPESEEIHITFDNCVTMRATQENGKILYTNFEKVDDEDIEKLLKTLCVETFRVLT